MAQLPQTLTREHVDARRGTEVWVRSIGLVVLALVTVLGLANVFGQATGETEIAGERARLTLRAPSAMRPGLVYQVMFRVDAEAAVEEPTILLDPGWFEGFTINTFEPDPVEWVHENGRNALVYGPIPAGGHLVARLQYQVNPTAYGSRKQIVVLRDGDEPLAAPLEHDAFVYP